MKKTILLLTAIFIFIVANYATADTREVDPIPLDNYLSFGEWNTDGDFDGWNLSSDVTNLAVVGGCITGKVAETEGAVNYDNWIRKDLGLGNYIVIPSGSVFDVRMRYNEVPAAGYYYVNDGAWDPINYAPGASVLTDGDFHVYRVMLTRDLNYSTLLRMDPYQNATDANTNSTFEIDWVRAKLSMMVDPIYEPSKSFGYTSLAEWNTPGDFENWLTANMLDPQVAGGYLTATNNGDGQIFKTNANGLPATDLGANKLLQIRIKRETTDNGSINLFYGTSVTPGFSGARLMDLIAGGVPKDGNFHIYQFDMSSESAWVGALEAIRLDATGHGGKFIEVDYIRIGQVVPEPAMFLTIAISGIFMLLKRK